MTNVCTFALTTSDDASYGPNGYWMGLADPGVMTLAQPIKALTNIKIFSSYSEKWLCGLHHYKQQERIIFNLETWDKDEIGISNEAANEKIIRVPIWTWLCP